MRLLRPLVTVAFVLGGLFAITETASAAFTVTISGTGLPGGTQTITDNNSPAGTQVDQNPAVNSILFSFGDIFTYNITGNITLIQNGDSVVLRLVNLNFQNNTINGTPVDFSNLQITVEATGLTALGPVMTSSLTVPSGLTTGSQNFTLQTTLSNVSASNSTSVNLPGPPTSSSVTTNVTPVSGYTLTSLYTIDVVPAGSTFNLGGSFSQLAPTPAPPTAVMALAGLPLLGLARVIRRRKALAATA